MFGKTDLCFQKDHFFEKIGFSKILKIQTMLRSYFKKQFPIFKNEKKNEKYVLQQEIKNNFYL